MFNRNIITKKSLERARNSSQQGDGYLANFETGNSTKITEDNYAQQLVKIIPGEIVSAYLALIPIVNVATLPYQQSHIAVLLWQWGLLLVLIFLTPFYLIKYCKTTSALHIAMSCVALLIWAYCIGGPFELYDWYNPVFGSIFAVLYGLVVRLVYSD